MQTPEGYKKWPDLFLLQPCPPLTSSDIKTKKMQDIRSYMQEYLSAHLFASKIGAISANVLGWPYPTIILFKDNRFLTINNPDYVSLSKEKILWWEGCLSFNPRLRLPIRRSKAIVIKGLDINGEEIRIPAKDKEAVLWGHEIDHTYGIVITSYEKRREFLAERKHLYVPSSQVFQREIRVAV